MGEWEKTEKAVCQWGMLCSKPVGDGEPCCYPPEQGKPILPCHVHHSVKLKWRCSYGNYPCYKPYECHYELVASRLIREWSIEERRQANAEWQREREQIHSLNEPREPVRGRFNGISRDILLSRQPAYYLEGLGISGLTFKPFAKVRVSSSYMHLYIDIGDSLKPMSKNKRRKAIRHGKPLPARVQDRIDLMVNKAVRRYLDR